MVLYFLDEIVGQTTFCARTASKQLGRFMSQIPSIHPTSQECVKLDQLEASYKKWVWDYSKNRENSVLCLRLYQFAQNDPPTFSFSPITPLGPLRARGGFLRAIWKGLSSFSFLPYTNVLPQSIELASDEEAILSDWVVTGLDLYQSARGCRILPPHGPAESPQPAPTR